MGTSKQDNIVNSYLAQFPSGLHYRKDVPDVLPKEDVEKLERLDSELDFSNLTFENVDENKHFTEHEP